MVCEGLYTLYTEEQTLKISRVSPPGRRKVRTYQMEAAADVASRCAARAIGYIRMKKKKKLRTKFLYICIERMWQKGKNK